MNSFTVNADGSEQLQYTMEDLPVRAFCGRLPPRQSSSAVCHWHDDFELLTPIGGEIDFWVNNRNIHLKQGDGIFINARRKHYGYSAQSQGCDYHFAVFHPRLLGEYPGIKSSVSMLCSEDRADCYTFSASSEIMLIFNELYAAAQDGNELRTLAKCAELLSEIARQEEEKPPESVREEWILLRRMIDFIHVHYTEKILLRQIAASGAVCRNRCCELFRKNLHVTPMEYVNLYRLDKASAALREGLSVTEAALSNGFHAASYFAEVFRRTYNMTPREYQLTFGTVPSLSDKPV